MNAARPAPRTKTSECKACQHTFEAKCLFRPTRGHYDWDDICPICTCLYMALAKMREAKALLAEAKTLAAERKK